MVMLTGPGPLLLRNVDAVVIVVVDNNYGFRLRHALFLAGSLDRHHFEIIIFISISFGFVVDVPPHSSIIGVAVCMTFPKWTIRYRRLAFHSITDLVITGHVRIYRRSREYLTVLLRA